MNETDEIEILRRLPFHYREERKNEEMALAIFTFCRGDVGFATRLLDDERYARVLAEGKFQLSYQEVLRRIGNLKTQTEERFREKFNRDKNFPEIGFQVLRDNVTSDRPIRYDSPLARIYLSLLRRYDLVHQVKSYRPMISSPQGIQLSLYK